MKALKIDSNGLFIEDIIVAEDFEQTADIIIIPCPEGFRKPKWNGAAWIEGLTQEEIDFRNNQPQPITESERITLVEQALNDIIMMMM